MRSPFTQSISIIRCYKNNTNLVNKASRHDNILIDMIKFCANAAADPFTLIFQNSVAAGTFSTFAIE